MEKTEMVSGLLLYLTAKNAKKKTTEVTKKAQSGTDKIFNG